MLDRERLVDIVDASLSVNGRAQFFLWAQGIVQCLVAHETLLCAIAEGAGFRVDRFALAALEGGNEPPGVQALAPQALARWNAVGRPLALEEQRAVLHAVRGADGGIAGWFCFAGLPAPLTARLAHVVEILVPHVYCTYARVVAHEGASHGTARRAAAEVTRREAEVLHWIREGKSNADIARILGLSPWTVKNHVQSTLKKLGVQNRAHAVSRAIAARLIPS
jgi:transcriptional regulator EpsA